MTRQRTLFFVCSLLSKSRHWMSGWWYIFWPTEKQPTFDGIFSQYILPHRHLHPHSAQDRKYYPKVLHDVLHVNRMLEQIRHYSYDDWVSIQRDEYWQQWIYTWWFMGSYRNTNKTKPQHIKPKKFFETCTFFLDPICFHVMTNSKFSEVVSQIGKVFPHLTRWSKVMKWCGTGRWNASLNERRFQWSRGNYIQLVRKLVNYLVPANSDRKIN
jgi:hypothetical protein